MGYCLDNRMEKHYMYIPRKAEELEGRMTDGMYFLKIVLF